MKKKIIWISSYLPRSCGIAYYSENYISALKDFSKKNLDIKIIAHTDAHKADYPIIDLKDKNWHYKVFKIIKKETPDIIHLQHEYGLYETYNDKNKRVIELIRMIKNNNFKIVITYHSVYKKLNPDFKQFVSSTLKLIDAGIFHCEYQKKALKINIKWNPRNVYVLPHGSEENIKVNREDIRKECGYNGNGIGLVVGSAGLASERKGYTDLIRQWQKVVKKIPNAYLSLELKPESAKETRTYINKVLGEIMKSSVSQNIEFVVKDYTKIEFYKRLASYDILVLPYKSESQSGVLAHGFSVGVPAVVTNIEGLGAEIRNSNAGITVKNRKYFYKAIIKLLSSKKLREKYSQNALRYVKKVNGWSIIAKKTINIYEKFW
jgi:glycosyltransferase involved in cell wall biosynthesis